MPKRNCVFFFPFPALTRRYHQILTSVRQLQKPINA